MLHLLNVSFKPRLSDVNSSNHGRSGGIDDSCATSQTSNGRTQDRTNRRIPVHSILYSKISRYLLIVEEHLNDPIRSRAGDLPFPPATASTRATSEAFCRPKRQSYSLTKPNLEILFPGHAGMLSTVVHDPAVSYLAFGDRWWGEKRRAGEDDVVPHTFGVSTGAKRDQMKKKTFESVPRDGRKYKSSGRA